jgi:hypothetical protein
MQGKKSRVFVNKSYGKVRFCACCNKFEIHYKNLIFCFEESKYAEFVCTIDEVSGGFDLKQHISDEFVFSFDNSSIKTVLTGFDLIQLNELINEAESERTLYSYLKLLDN